MVYKIEGLGWLADPPSAQDFTLDSAQIADILGQKFQGLAGQVTEKPPAVADITQFDTSIRDQLNIGSCVGHGVCAVMESAIKKETGEEVSLSPRYSYKTMRYKMGEFYEYNDTGAFIRSGIGAAVSHGVPPEGFWPYVAKDNVKNEWNDIPHALVIPFAMSFMIDKYMRLDAQDYPTKEVLNLIKTAVAVDQTPVVFGFSVFPSINSHETASTGKIRFRRMGEGSPIGGHAVAIVGYDDSITFGGTTGAFKIKNSWGTQ